MKSRIKEQGSTAHIIIIVALVVVVLGALGLVFWQNFINKSTESTNNQSNSNSTGNETVSLETASQTLDGYTLTFDYPSNWQVIDQNVKSPDGKTIVSIHLSKPDGLGGTCGEDDEATAVIEAIEWEASPSYSKALFASSIVKSSFYSGNFYTFSLEPASYEAIRTAKVGDSSCKTFSAVPGLIAVGSEGEGIYLRARVIFDALSVQQNASRTDLSVQEIQDVFNSEDAKQAKKILLSAKVTN